MLGSRLVWASPAPRHSGESHEQLIRTRATAGRPGSKPGEGRSEQPPGGVQMFGGPCPQLLEPLAQMFDLSRVFRHIQLIQDLDQQRFCCSFSML